METVYPPVGRFGAGHGFCLAGQLEVVGGGRSLAKVRAAPLREGPAATAGQREDGRKNSPVAVCVWGVSRSGVPAPRST